MKFTGLILIAILSTLNALSWGQGNEMTRREFVMKIADIKKGSTRQQVKGHLGTPNKVLKVPDMRPNELPDVVRYTSAAEVWYYGTNDRSDFPTFGQVHFDASSKVIITYGGEGTPINVESISEEKLRDLLRLLHTMPQADGQNWDIVVVIKIVNALFDLGKNDGLAVIQEFIRVSPESYEIHEQVGLLLRMMHEVPENTGYFPELLLGYPLFGPPPDPKLIPRYPIHVLRHEIPVMLVNGYSTTGGVPGNTTEILEWYKVNGRWRRARIEVPALSAEEIKELKGQVMDLLEQYLDAPQAKATTNNVYSQLNRLKKSDE